MPTAIGVLFGVTPKPPKELSTVTELKTFLSVTDAELAVIAKHRSRMYTIVPLPKKSGGVRFIQAPDNRLAYLQRRLLEVFETMYTPRKVVHGFVAGRSSVTNANQHIKRKYVLNVDLKDFFPSIRQDRISGLLFTLGVPADVCKHVCSICCVRNQLPQGAPTSPILSNMIAMKMDRQLMSFCKPHRIRYTRYADDLTFSVFTNPRSLFNVDTPPPGKLDPQLISTELLKIVEANGFVINDKKVRFFGQNSRKEITGILVSDTLNLRRTYIRRIRSMLFCIEKDGYPAAQVKFSALHLNISSLREHLRGRISWLSQVKGINDEVYINLARRFNNSFPNYKMRIGHSKGEVRDLSNWVLESDAKIVKKCKQGSAFFLDGVGLVTAYHCVEGAKTIEVFHPHDPANRYKVTIQKSCKYRDLAILDHSVPTNKFLALTALGLPIRTGEKVSILGYPSFGPGSNLQVREARVVGTQAKSAVKQFIVDGKINQGNSGGPIVDSFDRVVGVAHKGGPSEAIDVAVAIQELAGL